MHVLLEGRCCRGSIRTGVEYVFLTKRGTYGTILPRPGYLQKKGGSQVVKGVVLHSGPVGASKRGRDGAEEGSRN